MNLDRTATVAAGEAAMKQYSRAAAQHVTRVFSDDAQEPLIAGWMKRLDRAILAEIIESNHLPDDGWPEPEQNPTPRMVEPE